jgi:hypothetical protein
VYFGEALRARKELDSLNLNIFLAADASNALPDRAAYAPAGSVAATDASSFWVGSDGGDDTRGFGVVYATGGAVACGHLRAGVADALVVLQGPLDGEGGLSLAFEIVWVVLLRVVRICL